ncbi:MAG: threonine synthase, partial [Planctomycetota bacterium]
KHEGENPTGSFKDRGMTVAISMAKQLGFNRVACASTGNTSASMASYAASAGMRSYVFVPDGKISSAKLSQALASGALTLQLSGNFDDAMRAIEQICNEENIYLVNSINPFRIEGQKAIAFELMQDLEWKAPDWIIVPGGNLGNNSAIIKGLMQLRELNLIDKLPKVAVIQAAGANPLAVAWRKHLPVKPMADPKTIASAICIGNPVSWSRSIRSIQEVGGCVDDVYDAEILDAKAIVDASGIGAEPASCATVAGLKKLVEKNVVKKEETVCCVLTGHALKDTETTSRYHEGQFLHTARRYRNPPVKVECSMAAIREVLKNHD